MIKADGTYSDGYEDDEVDAGYEAKNVGGYMKEPEGLALFIAMVSAFVALFIGIYTGGSVGLAATLIAQSSLLLVYVSVKRA